eukprot:CAMPEP_0115042508 /NCGR_PEP_ID=MMETSP0216-20121206/46306_1 /TAXON_ID=223996 /ORGANISM="Protocruzia adherens, Strain Boccale" /LENGTH=218 /DNA_ID=CAMNT_0002424633 /DNA_START=627 /DNA_END=1283 /DNA_ORIENTATION=+
MVDLLADQQVFLELMKQYLPDLHDHLEAQSIDVTQFSLQWFISIFAQNFHERVAVRIWDVFFLEKETFLFKVGLAAFKLLEEDLRKENDFAAIHSLMYKISEKITDPMKLLELTNRKFKIDEKTLTKMRAKHRQLVMLQLKGDHASCLADRKLDELDFMDHFVFKVPDLEELCFDHYVEEETMAQTNHPPSNSIMRGIEYSRPCLDDSEFRRTTSKKI